MALYKETPLLAPKYAKSRKLPRKFKLIAGQSSEVIDLGVNRKRIMPL